MKAEKPLIVLVGPTAVGKSALAIDLAQNLGTELINADSRHVYRGMDIGTAKPTLPERARVVHHLLDEVNPDQPFNAGRFRELASPVIDKLHQQGRVPIVVGGTGLYVKILVNGVWPLGKSAESADWALRDRLRKDEENLGPGYLHRRLGEVDSESAGRIHPGDVAKVIRALEVYEKTGRPISDFHREHRFQEKPFRAVTVGLRRTRPDLYGRIEKRVDRMIEDGLVEEVRGLLSRGYSPDMSSMKALGYRQIAGYLLGRYGRDEAIQVLKRDTKRYAKRQFTWFNRDPSVQWIDLEEEEDAHTVFRKTIGVIRKEIGLG